MRRAAGTLTLAVAALLAAAPAFGEDVCPSVGCKADVSVSGHAEPTPIRVGENSEFKFTVANNGPQTSYGAMLHTTIPSGLRVTSVQSYGKYECSADGAGKIDCAIGDLVNEQLAVVLVKVRGLKVGKYVVGATVNEDSPSDPNGGNSQVSATMQVLAPSGGVATISAADPQRILKTGGVTLTFRPKVSGDFKVTGEVATASGMVKLATVELGGSKAGSARKVFLGTSSSALSRIRAGLKGGKRLRVILRAQMGGETIRTEIHVRA